MSQIQQVQQTQQIQQIQQIQQENLNSSLEQGLRAFLKTTLEVPDAFLGRLVQDVAASLDVQLDAQSPPGLPGTLFSSSLSAAASVIRSWPVADQASFIHGHPRIGEVSGLSVLSAQEQAKYATPQHVLQRLAYLNAEYERRYPGLRYITFVNGRSRAEIATELEQKLALDAGEAASLSETTVHQLGSPQWSAELDRALTDIGLIALSRSKNM